MNSQARSAKERSVAWNTWMGTAPASTLGCEEPFVKCNKAMAQWHRDATLGWVWGKGIAVGHSQSSQHLCAHRQREQPEPLLPPCSSSLIYLANFKSAGGFTGTIWLVAVSIWVRELQRRVNCIPITQPCLPSRTMLVLWLHKFLSHFQLLPLLLPGFDFPWIHISSVRILLFLFLREEGSNTSLILLEIHWE